ncbi:hypothetical protein ES705_39440 [subsurface metagenome]
MYAQSLEHPHDRNRIESPVEVNSSNLHFFHSIFEELFYHTANLRVISNWQCFQCKPNSSLHHIDSCKLVCMGSAVFWLRAQNHLVVQVAIVHPIVYVDRKIDLIHEPPLLPGYSIQLFRNPVQLRQNISDFELF